MNAIPGLDHLAWDTEFFGRRIGRLAIPSLEPEALDRTLAAASAAGYECLYCLQAGHSAVEAALLEERGFRLRDVRLEFEGETRPEPLDPGIREGGPADVEPVLEIAGRAFTTTRFAQDPMFPRERVAALYAHWAARSFTDTKQRVLVAGRHGAPDGFVTVGLDDGRARIGLIGVAADARGRGVGHRLVSAALQWGAAQGTTRLRVVTQALNQDAQKLYQRAGLTTCSVARWYHLWPARAEAAQVNRT